MGVKVKDSVYITLLPRAREIAEQAHQGQEREGDGYHIDHVLRVVDRCRTSELQLVAMLHDVVEDSEWTLDDLYEEFPSHIVKAVDAISRRPCRECEGEGRMLSSAKLGKKLRELERIEPDIPTPRKHRIVWTIADPDWACGICSGSGTEGRESYIERVKANELARAVKRADATDNMGTDPRPGMRQRYQWWLEKLDEG